MGRAVVVLDLNGILVDVRRREAAAVRGRVPDAVLPNGQKVFLHPHAGDFLRWIFSLKDVDVVTYTSRLRHNADPVEKLLESSTPSAFGPEVVFRPVAKLHGEDCKPAGTNRSEPFHPVKTLGFVIEAVESFRQRGLTPLVSHRTREPLHALHSLHPKDAVRERDVIFVDDHPSRIESGGAKVIRAGGYDASDEMGTAGHLLETLGNIRAEIERRS